jgi:hypothetical protein
MSRRESDASASASDTSDDDDDGGILATVTPPKSGYTVRVYRPCTRSPTCSTALARLVNYLCGARLDVCRELIGRSE